MNERAIYAELVGILGRYARAGARLGPEADLARDLLLDSLARMSLVVEVEDHFHVSFDEADDAGVQRVGDLVRLIARRTQDRAAP